MNNLLRPTSSRVRILGWVLVPVGVVLVIAWITARGLLINDVESRIDLELRGEVAELRLLAEEGINPGTGEPFADARTLNRYFLENSIPDANETMFSIVDGVVDARSSDVPPERIDANPQLIDQVSSIDRVTFGDIETGQGVVRYAAAPVTGRDGGEGVLVVGIFADLELDATNSVLRTLLLALLAALVIAATIGWFVAGRVLAPVRAMRATAQSIGESDLTRRIPIKRHSTNDEVSQLAATFNQMLDRLQEAFATQRDFIDDAGHELKTPLTIIRGHLDLMTLTTNDDERDQSLKIVRDELERMTRIVNDLQTLTKARRPDFVVLSPTDVSELLDEMFVKANALGDRSWVIDASHTGMVTIDRQRITQAMMQLAANAVAHTKDGQEIGLGLSIKGEWLSLWVRDTGEGVAVDVRDRIFERFARSSATKLDLVEDVRGGAGLGLAIVSAIATAHEGRVRAEDTAGGGATFIIDIPIAQNSGG